MKQWRVSECQEIFKKVAKKAFTRRALVKAVSVKSKSWYRTKPIEEVLKASFGEDLLFSGGNENPEGGQSGPIRVAVTATSATEGNPVILANYNTGARRSKGNSDLRGSSGTRILISCPQFRTTSSGRTDHLSSSRFGRLQERHPLRRHTSNTLRSPRPEQLTWTVQSITTAPCGSPSMSES